MLGGSGGQTRASCLVGSHTPALPPVPYAPCSINLAGAFLFLPCPPWLHLAPPLGHHCQLCPMPAEIMPMPCHLSSPAVIGEWRRVQSLCTWIVLWKFRPLFSGCEPWRLMAVIHFCFLPRPQPHVQGGHSFIKFSTVERRVCFSDGAMPSPRLLLVLIMTQEPLRSQPAPNKGYQSKSDISFQVWKDVSGDLQGG